MSIKTVDVVPGAVVTTTKPKNPLKFPGDHLVVMGEDASMMDGNATLPFGTVLTIISNPKRKGDVAAKIVELESTSGQKLTTFLSYLKSRVTLVE